MNGIGNCSESSNEVGEIVLSSRQGQAPDSLVTWAPGSPVTLASALGGPGGSPVALASALGGPWCVIAPGRGVYQGSPVTLASALGEPRRSPVAVANALGGPLVRHCAW